ncbi:thioredoxin domain-containing protein [Tundrisphaera lichenicola]|uniref:thioredoxin domain-containing protein n=1 Tax=Tundrisphaera lichenicola TaxID=2029860 RepID=UPI003EBC2B7C
MTIAPLLIALIVTAAAENSGEPVLLDFHASWCSPCRQMRPEVEKLVRKGYPVKSIDIDRSPELSERYKVTAVPTFVIVDANGKVLNRASGAMPAVQLATFYNETKTRAPSAISASEEEEPEGAPSRLQDQSPEEVSEAESQPGTPLINPKPWETVVRIKMHLSDSEWGFGSGTIIHSTAEESIILTCAHIFRIKGRQQPSPKNFRVPISVDLFDGQFVSARPAMIRCSEKDIPGEAIDYDFNNDVGLIRIRPGRVLAASRVVPPDWQPQQGMKMFSVGCSHGRDATAWDTTILDPRVGMSNSSTKQGFATMKCAHQPMEGRSGGGLYTTDGYVAGVCDFADPNEKVGLYAVPDAIHRLLDRNQLMALYKRGGDQGGTMLASDRSRARSRGSSETYVRAQNSPLREPVPAADAITLPPFDMVASRDARNAAVTSGAKAWQAGENRTAPPRQPRSSVRPDLAANLDNSIDPGAPVTTELEMEPSAEDRAFERTRSELSRTEPTAPAGSPRSAAGWKPARQALPDLVGSSRSRR